jgi:hypothetical protein
MKQNDGRGEMTGDHEDEGELSHEISADEELVTIAKFLEPVNAQLAGRAGVGWNREFSAGRECKQHDGVRISGAAAGGAKG